MSARRTNRKTDERRNLSRTLTGGALVFIFAIQSHTAAAQGRPEIEWMRGGNGNRVYPVAYSPDGTLPASASADATAKLWRVADGSLDLTDVEPFIELLIR